MFHMKQRRLLTQADIDRSINLQSSEIKKDFNARLSGKENDTEIMIDSLIKLKMNKLKTLRTESDSRPTKLKTPFDFEKEMSVENPLTPKTAEIGVAATSKDIDFTFYRRVNRFSSGDQVTPSMEPVVKSKQKKLIPRELQKQKTSKTFTQHDNHHQVKIRILRGQIDSKTIPKQVTLPNRVMAPKRQMNFNSNKSISTTNSTRQRIISTKRIEVTQAKPQKVINRKIR